MYFVILLKKNLKNSSIQFLINDWIELQSLQICLYTYLHINICTFYIFIKVYYLYVPHGVKDCAIFHYAEEFVRGSYIVSHRSFPIPEEGVRSPHFGHHQVI